MSRRDDEELMAFLDGELPPRDAREVEARIGASADTRQKVEALNELSTLVRSHYQQATDEAEPGMAAAWAKLEAQLGSAPPAREPAVAARNEGGLWQAFVDALVPRWSHFAVGAVGAAAGAILAFSLSSARIQIVTVKEPYVVPGVNQVEPPSVLASFEDTNVDELDVTSGTGMVFQVPSKSEGKTATTTTVIWVTDDDAPMEGPI